jgi:acetylornithine deacetylase/succinyl-diaminopimelate desuccinylase-like protein
MNLEHWINRALEIQAIPAPTFHEEARADYLHQAFMAAGLKDVAKDEIGNIYGRVSGGSKPAVVVSAHLDTVFPLGTELSQSLLANRVIGPGIGDNAIALAALVELGQDLVDLPGDVWLVANVGEEGLGNLRGMRKLVDRYRDEVSAYIVVEGMALGYVYHRGLPVKRFKLTASGKGGHSWIHFGRESAVHALIRFADHALSHTLPTSPKTTINIGRFEGGSSINSIAEHAFMEIDIRSESELQVDELTLLLNQLTLNFPLDGVKLELEEIGSRPAGALPPQHPLVKAAVDALNDVGETKPHLETGSTDANVPLSLGYPAVCIGLTRGGDAHTVNEYIEMEPLPRGYQALLGLIRSAFMLE